jgi:hypothetical protein
VGRSVVAIGLLAGLAVRSEAQAPAAPDFARAKQLYDTASSELEKGAFSDAVRDFGAAYDITKDPVVFYKIAVANEKAGKCDVALVYYARYLREAKPAQHFVDLTKEHVALCGGDWKSIDAHTPELAGMDPPLPPGSDAGIATGSATGTQPPPADAGSNAGSAQTPSSDTSPSSNTSGSRSTDLAPVAPTPAAHRHGHDLPWLMVGGALAFVTAGAVLAYSASSSEQDIRDLYVGLNSMTPTFDANTQQRYQDLLDEGHRYQYLSWGAFGLAGGFALAATLLFVRDYNQEQNRIVVTPTASGNSAGVSAKLSF